MSQEHPLQPVLILGKEMATSPSGMNSPPEKHIPESIYRKHVLRARSTRNHFTFCRDWTWVMTKMEALFLQDIINRASSPKIHRETIKDDKGEEREYVLLSNKYLSRPPMGWDDKACAKHLSSLKDKGFVRIMRKGWKTKRFCRWVHIDVLQIETVLDEALKDPPHRGSLRSPSEGMLRSPSEGIFNAQSPPGRGSKERSESNKVQSEKSSLSDGYADPTKRSSLFPDLEKKIERPEDKDRATRLWNRLTEKRLLDSKSKFKKWVEEFRDLRDKDGVPDEEIERTLKEYLPRISLTMSSKEEGFLPQAFSAKTFRSKYLNICARIACLVKETSSSETDEIAKILFRKAKRSCEESGEYDVTQKGRVKRKLPGSESWEWIEEGKEWDWGLSGEVYVYIRYVRGNLNKDSDVVKRLLEGKK